MRSPLPFRAGCLLLVVTLALPGLQVQANTIDTAAWARDLLQASRQSDYHGTIMVMQGSLQQAFSLWHDGDENDFEERMRLLDGPAMELVRTPERVTCIHAPGSEVPEDHDIPASPFGSLQHLDPQQVAANYRLTAEGSDRLGDRIARIYSLESRHAPSRLTHQIWVDEMTGVALRHSRFDESGNLLEDVRFVQFEAGVGDVPRAIRSAFPEAFWHRFGQTAAGRDAGADQVWQLDPVPAGFRREVEEQSNGDWYQLWSDGMVEFSLMVEPIVGAMPEPTMERRGSTLLMSAVHGDWLVVLVGDVPESLARQVLTDISWQ